jgi:hypothetical protein
MLADVSGIYEDIALWTTGTFCRVDRCAATPFVVTADIRAFTEVAAISCGRGSSLDGLNALLAGVTNYRRIEGSTRCRTVLLWRAVTEAECGGVV